MCNHRIYNILKILLSIKYTVLCVLELFMESYEMSFVRPIFTYTPQGPISD